MALAASIPTQEICLTDVSIPAGPRSELLRHPCALRMNRETGVIKGADNKFSRLRDKDRARLLSLGKQSSVLDYSKKRQ